MKGHTVPWAFLPKELQTLLAIALLVMVIKHTYRDKRLVRRIWPWLFAVVAVLLSPQLMGWLGFGPQGIRAKTMAAELQSLATSLPWLMQVISALQSISTKGMGLKTAGIIFTAGGALGRVLMVPAYDRLVEMNILREPQEQLAGNSPEEEEANPGPHRAVQQGNPLAQPPGPQPSVPPHAHDD